MYTAAVVDRAGPSRGQYDGPFRTHELGRPKINKFKYKYINNIICNVPWTSFNTK